MKDEIKLSNDFDSEYDIQGIFIDVCKAAVALTLLSTVLYTLA